MKTADIKVGEVYAMKAPRWSSCGKYVEATVLRVGVQKLRRTYRSYGSQGGQPYETGPANRIEVAWEGRVLYGMDEGKTTERTDRVLPQEIYGPYAPYHAEQEKQRVEDEEREKKTRAEIDRQQKVAAHYAERLHLLDESWGVTRERGGRFIIHCDEAGLARIVNATMHAWRNL